MQRELMRLSDVQRALACSRSHIYRLRAASILIPIDISLTGRPCLRWRPEDVDKLIRERKSSG